MKKVNHGFFIFCMTVIISGCSTYYPVPVDEENIQQRLAKQQSSFGLSIAVDQKKALENMKTYSEWYALKSNELKSAQLKLGDAGLGMMVAGLIAGITGKAKGAAESTLLSTVLDMPSSRYKIEVQAANYEKASDAMACMYRYLIPLHEAEGGMDSIPDINFLNEKIDETRKKLRKLQADVVLAEPDVQKIKSALAVVLPSMDDRVTASSALSFDVPVIKYPSVEEVKAQLDTCVAVFSK